MIPPTIERWEHVVKSRDLDLLDQLLADDVVFESPVVHTPQVGRAIARAYLTAALQVLNSHAGSVSNRLYWSSRPDSLV